MAQEAASIMEKLPRRNQQIVLDLLRVMDSQSALDKKTEKTVKYVIDKSLRWRVRDMLDQMNISERIVYPGLSGLSRWIARHYYVM